MRYTDENESKENSRERLNLTDDEPAMTNNRKQKVQNFRLNLDDSAFDQDKSNSDFDDDQINVDEWLASANSPQVTEDINSYSGEEQKQKMDKEERLALKSYKKSEKKRIKAKAEKNGCMFRLIWFAMIVVVSVILGMFLWNGFSDLLGESRKEEESTIVLDVPENANMDQVVNLLLETSAIKEEGFFRLYAKITKSESDFVSGIHSLRGNMDYEAILNNLQSGKQLTDIVTIQFKEGLSVLEYAQLLEENNVCKKDEFLKYCQSDEFDDEYKFIKEIKENKKRVYKLEGYLFPDTYDFYIGEDPADSIRRFLSNFRKKCFVDEKYYDGYDDKMTVADYLEISGQTLDDTINLASLIQSEAANTKDMYVISSIFQNRLDTMSYGGVNEYGEGGMGLLGSDATYNYPYPTREDVPEDIRKTFVSDYDTYKNEGLPPGAICSPGLNAIDAALVPDDTGYYYFCHKAATETEAAKPYYAYTEAEHLANIEEAGLEPAE